MTRLLTEETREEVVHNPLNDSTSKNLWSFPRDQRFRSERKYCPYVAYDYNLSTHSCRKAAFGYGSRTDFRLDNKFTPSPAYYDLNRSLQSKMGKTFGISRDKIQHKGYISIGQLKNPAPGDYQLREAESRKDRGYSMRPKTSHERNYFIEDQEQAAVPGPGQYHEINVNLGRNYISKFRSTKTPNLLNSTSKRFKIYNRNPGPGNYFQGPIRTQPLVSNHTSTSGTLGKSNRQAFTDSIARGRFAPGPGNYRVPSDFGHYLKQ